MINYTNILIVFNTVVNIYILINYTNPILVRKIELAMGKILLKIDIIDTQITNLSKDIGKLNLELSKIQNSKDPYSDKIFGKLETIRKDNVLINNFLESCLKKKSTWPLFN